jgi:biotin carboxyl carrier protein
LDVTIPASAEHWKFGHEVHVTVGEEWCDVAVERDGPVVWAAYNGAIARFTLPESHGEDTDHEARAPMTGKLVSIPVKIGDEVKRGDTVAVLEAMKMEYKLEAEADGIVEEIGAKEGDLVDLGQLLVKLK